MKQNKQHEWTRQWELFDDNELHLFEDWIYPNTLDDFIGKSVLECGCGSGQHTGFVAPYAKSVTVVDLNTIDIAEKNNKNFDNIEFIEEDIITMDLKKEFDIVFSIGVVHHTGDPDECVKNLIRHLKPGGRLILWVYSEEGNFLVIKLVEPFRKLLLARLDRNKVLFISRIITALLYIPIYSLYLLPLEFLPYYDYFRNFRKLSFSRNLLNVFDKLNAPQVDFISEERVKKWFGEDLFENIHIDSYKKVSWRGSGRKKY